MVLVCPIYYALCILTVPHKIISIVKWTTITTSTWPMLLIPSFILFIVQITTQGTANTTHYYILTIYILVSIIVMNTWYPSLWMDILELLFDYLQLHKHRLDLNFILLFNMEHFCFDFVNFQVFLLLALYKDYRMHKSLIRQVLLVVLSQDLHFASHTVVVALH